MRIIGGRLSGRRFGAPRGQSTRPTSARAREALASALQSRNAFEGATVLDLFAGTGALSFEALSRGATSALVVDRDPRAIRQMRRSAEALGLQAEMRILQQDLLGDPSQVARRLPMPEHGFELVFVDAPYSQINRIPALLRELANSRRLAAGAWVAVEHPSEFGWVWPNGLASDADYRYGPVGISLGVHEPEKGS